MIGHFKLPNRLSFAAARAPVLACVDCSLLVNLCESGRQHIELLLPILAISVKPHGRIEEGPHCEAAPADTAAALLLNQSGAHEHLNVTRDALQRYFKRRREL